MRAADFVVSPPPEPPGEPPESRTLAGAMGLGVRADDLLGERGARARHADDEHRRWFGIPGARAPRIPLGREGRDRRVVIGPGRLARERLQRLQQRMAARHWAKALASSPMRDQNLARS